MFDSFGARSATCFLLVSRVMRVGELDLHLVRRRIERRDLAPRHPG